MPKIVTHKELNEAAEQPKTGKAEDVTRSYISVIRKAFRKYEIPYTISDRRGAGYTMKSAGRSTSSKERKAKQ
jgi:DNA-binding response OmpR family regulator